MLKCLTTEHWSSFFCLLSNFMSVGYDKLLFYEVQGNSSPDNTDSSNSYFKPSYSSCGFTCAYRCSCFLSLLAPNTITQSQSFYYVYLDINKESHHYHATFLHPDSLDLSCVPVSPEALMYWLLCIFTALSAVRSCTARRLRLEKNKIGTNITNFTTIWTPRSYVYNGELTLFLAARILFNLYKLSVTYCDLISKGMNISLYCIILTLSGTHTHTHTLNLKIEAVCFSTMLVSVSKTTLSYTTEHHLQNSCWSASLHNKSSDSKAPCFLNFSTS